MRCDSPLAEKEIISAEDLVDKPLIISRQAFQKKEFHDFFPCEPEKLNIAATYNLLFNGSLMVEEGMGYAICFDNIINVSGKSGGEISAETSGYVLIILSINIKLCKCQ